MATRGYDTNLCDLEIAIVRLSVQCTSKVRLSDEEAQEGVVFIDLVRAQEVDWSVSVDTTNSTHTARSGTTWW